MEELFVGTGIAHSILLFSFVIGTGLLLSRFSIKGVSIGSTWILFVGILVSHFGFVSDPVVLSFMKDFGLILFVFSIGLQVGPGFFQSFKKGGVKMNLMAVMLILLAVATTCLISVVSGEDLRTMTGVMSGAVTNTPGLGAAQQTLSDSIISTGGSATEAASSSANLASAYAVAYPIGVIGVIFLLILTKSVFKIDLDKEKAQLDNEGDSGDRARRMHCLVSNPAVNGRKLREIMDDMGHDFVVSRLMRGEHITTPGPDTEIFAGDKLLVVTSEKNVDHVRIIFGEEVPLHVIDWSKMDETLVSKRVVVTKSSITGRKLKELNIRSLFGVTVTRVERAGLQMVANGNSMLQVGDFITVVGSESAVNEVGKFVGNKPQSLNHPHLGPIFFGIVLGVILGMIPIKFPGIPQPVKLGLAGGPLIVAIFIGYFGPKLKITTYTTQSANMMIREIGISFFMAAVGLGAGRDFVSSLMGGGYWWILYGALITIVPILITIIVARVVLKMNFYQILGLVTGTTTNPPALAFAQNAYGTDYTSVNYATVYPLSMFMRVLVAQVMILATL